MASNSFNAPLTRVQSSFDKTQQKKLGQNIENFEQF